MGKKPDWVYKQSAVIPYLGKNSSVQIVLIESRSKSGWIYPKGVIERFMTPEDSAAKEALEEAGVTGITEPNVLDEYTYDKWEGTCCVKVYPLEVSAILDEWIEMRVRERIIVDLDEAISLVKSTQKPSLLKFKEYLLAKGDESTTEAE